MFKQLQKVLSLPRMIMKIENDNGDGTVRVVSDSGLKATAIGNGIVGSRVYVQEGRILGAAADLPHSELEV